MALIPMVPFPGAHFDVPVLLEGRGLGVLRTSYTPIRSTVLVDSTVASYLPVLIASWVAAADVLADDAYSCTSSSVLQL